jgi:hypothetical protein
MLASGTGGLVVSMLASGTGGLVVSMLASGTGGLVVSMLASGSLPTEAVGFFLLEKSTACLPSEGK